MFDELRSGTMNGSSNLEIILKYQVVRIIIIYHSMPNKNRVIKSYSIFMMH